MKEKEIEQAKKLLERVVTVKDTSGVEGIIKDVKGKVFTETEMGYWEGKTSCWEMFRCPDAIKNECPAFKDRSIPCWQMEGTYCKLSDNGKRGDSTDICQNCRVYKRWGNGEPIELKLFGKGFNTVSAEKQQTKQTV